MVIARGYGGELRCGYHVAAQLGRWALDHADDTLGGQGWAVSAEVLGRDSYWFEHGEQFSLRLRFGRHWWRWREVTVQDGGGTIRGQGSPEVSDA